MTSKQKANQERFKKVVKEAAKLRKANKKLTQAQAVKQAWVIMKYKEGKNPINKIKNYVEKAKEDIKKGYYGSEYKKKRKKVGAMPTKVKAKKGKRTNKMHTDTKSHNVNIRVMSGFNFSIEELKFLESEGKKSKGYKYRAKILWGSPIVLKETKNGTPIQKWYVDDLKKAEELTVELNKGQNFTKVKGKSIK